MGFFSLLARIGLQTSSFEQGISKCEVLAKRFGSSVSHELRGTIGGFLTLGFLVDTMAESFRRAGRVKELSERLGIDTDKLQEMQFAAQQTGASIEDMARAIQGINKARGIALQDPNNKQSKLFEKFGIFQNDLKNMRGEDIFYKISDKIKDGANAQQEFNDAVSLMGKSAVPAFSAMRQGLREFAAEAHRTGQILEEDIIDKYDTTEKKFTRNIIQFGNTLARGANWVFDKITYAGTYWGAVTGAGTANNVPGGVNGVINKTLSDIEKEDSVKKIKKATPPATFDATAKGGKSKKEEEEKWTYKPSSDGLSSVGGFGRSASSAMVSNLEYVKEATEKTADNTEQLLRIQEQLDSNDDV